MKTETQLRTAIQTKIAELAAKRNKVKKTIELIDKNGYAWDGLIPDSRHSLKIYNSKIRLLKGLLK